MSASMRSTLQTVPESVPADHVTNSKPYHKAIQPTIYCDRPLNLLPLERRITNVRSASSSAVTTARHSNGS
ncbi:serine/threonine-protein kinase MARK2 isoform X9 [Vespula squamosa]|uniref:Serine/threonine-protein kinase MARK2 isoform X9 n=1 Tax=Vespula squamosa TaxID=30214 RepID=A0ABD1ZW05_VESSQ